MDIKVLINEVCHRKPLWNGRDPLHHNRVVVDNLWDETAASLGSTRDAVKAKWKGLRDTFRKELNKILVTARSGDHTTLPTSNWIHFDDLLFLRDVMLRVKGTAVLHHESGSDPDENSEYDSKVMLMPDESNAGETESHIQNLLGDLAGPSRGLKRPFEEVDSDAVQRVAGHHGDDDYHFLMSMLPAIRSLPLQKKMFVRWKFHELLYNILAEK